MWKCRVFSQSPNMYDLYFIFNILLRIIVFVIYKFPLQDVLEWIEDVIIHLPNQSFCRQTPNT